MALEQQIGAEWGSGHHRQAAVALGALASLVGRDPATARCPEPMVAELDRWEAAIAEGRARGAIQPGPAGT